MLSTPYPRLAVTIGDPAGIGPEVVLKALADAAIAQMAKITIVGSRKLLHRAYQHLRSLHPEIPLVHPEELEILDLTDSPTDDQIVVGNGNAASGAVSFRYLKTAIQEALAGNVEGIVTAPIAKSAWKAAGYHYPGQTELLAEMAGVDRFGMLFVARSPHTNWTLRTLLATTHIPLRQVTEVLTPELLSLKLDLLIECLRQDFGIAQPQIAIAGLNPHSGEQGHLGREEQDWLIPWLAQARTRYPSLQLEGPIPPDTLWVKPGQAWFGTAPGQNHDRPHASASRYADVYLALYHDQGLIPVKLMAFDRAVNTSIGLPFIRTSPDHGTAFDIAGGGTANATSMQAAIQLASELCRQRRQPLMAATH